MFKEEIHDYLESVMPLSKPLHRPKLKTPIKTLNDFLEKVLGDLHSASSGSIMALMPWVNDMVTKNGKKRLKKIFEKYEDTCEDLGCVDFDQFRAFYYLLAIVVEQVENS